MGIKKKLIALHDYNEKLVVDRIGRNLLNKIIILISDAGSPLISDPGFNLLRHCIKNNVNVTTVPGPSSIIPALQMSGIPINKFNFIGFAPKTKKHIEDFIKEISETKQTTVFFVSSHKLMICLEIMNTMIDKRSISVSKEITKVNEKVFRGKTFDVINEMSKNKENFRGEFVVVVEGSSLETSSIDSYKIYKKEVEKLLLKFSLTDVVEIVHKLTGITKNKAYKWILTLKKS